MLGARRNGLSDLPQASYTLGGGESWLAIFLIVSYMHGCDQNGLSELLQPSYLLGGGKNRLSVPLQASYTPGGGQNGHSQHLQASYMLGGGQNVPSGFLQVSYMLGSANWTGRSLEVLWSSHFISLILVHVPTFHLCKMKETYWSTI